MKTPIVTVFGQNERDLLIRLDTKFDIMTSTMQDIKDTVNGRVRTIEASVANLVKTHDEIQPEKGRKELDELLVWQHDFSVRWKFVVSVVGGVSAAIGLVIGIIVAVSRIVPIH